MTKSFIYSLLTALLLTVALASGCSSQASARIPLYQQVQYYNYLQSDFEQYVAVSRAWLAEHRGYVGADKQQELDMNAPFILHPQQPSEKAVLLVHGLSDSPFSFVDIGRDLQQRGYHVYALLLPGHGSKPEDMMLPGYADWQQIVDHYADILKDDYEQLWLGGFSTGANLVTVHALEQGGVDGLLLFSPGFQSQAPRLEKLTPLLAAVTDWGWKTEEDNAARYSSSPLNAAIAYSDSATVVRQKLETAQVEVPTLIVVSAADSVIDVEAVKQTFTSRFVHPGSRLIWYGEEQQPQPRTQAVSMQLPELQISTGSHMSPLFSPDNPYYGRSGDKRICENGYSRGDKARCEQGEPVWYSAWGYTETDKIYARLTWNPHYQQMVRQMSGVMAQPGR